MSVNFYPGEWIPTPAEVRPYVESDVVLSFIDELDGERDVNLANANARSLLSVLGLLEVDEFGDAELSGHADATDFLGRVLIAMTLTPVDEGMPAYQLNPGSDGARMWAAPRPEGYLQDRLQELADLATFCREHGHLVVWC